MTRRWAFLDLRRVIRILRVCLLVVVACSYAAALDNDRTIAQFAHTAWGRKEGAPGAVRALAQSADGYLWLGTDRGLYRFDGLVFEPYQPQSGGPIPARSVNSLLALPSGDLWVGLRSGGIILLRDGRATTYASDEGVPNEMVYSFAQDREGTIWAATNSGLIRLEGNRWKEVGKDWNFPGQMARTTFLDRQGTLWVATEDTLVFLLPGARSFQLSGMKLGQVAQIRQAANEKFWMAETTRSVRPVPLSDKRLPPDDTEVQVGSQGILFDTDGALWISSIGDGLRRAPNPESLRGKSKEFSAAAVESFTAKDGLSDDIVLTIFQDREGNIWVGTRNGLDRFRKTNLVPYPLPSFNTLYAVLAMADDGNVWLINQNAAVLIPRKVPDYRPRPRKAALRYAYRDPTGAIWWVGTNGLQRYKAGSFTRFRLPPSFPNPYVESSMVATEDGSGTLWLGAERQGLFYLENGTWQRLERSAEFAKLSPHAAFTDGMGRAWFGYADGTVILAKDKSILKKFSPGDCPVGNVRAIGGQGRHTWIGGDLGLAFFDGNRFRRTIPADAESFESVMGVYETSGGDLWLAESRGVIEITAPEAQQSVDDPSHRVRYRLFDALDGLPGTFATHGSLSREALDTNGLLWFVASSGVASVDPANISTNTLPPPVAIRYVKTNGRQLDSPGNLVLPPRTTDLQISYTALSLSVPERARFRYRLEGVDKDWQDAGTRRDAFYTRLGPGQYHFQVIAGNNDGVWNDKGVRLDFEIEPAWSQTNWFRVGCGLAFLSLLWELYQFRLQQLRRQFNVQLEARINERERIARDLHDTFFQGIQGLLLRFHTATSQLPKDEPARQILEETLRQSDQVMLEGRELVLDLRATASEQNDLASAFADFGEGMRKASSCDFKVVVNGAIRSLHPVVFEELFKIGKEALGNAFRHSGAHSIEAELNYEANELRLRIRDDGTGIDAVILRQGHRDGHFGMPGMKERAGKVGAHLDVWSRSGAGTEVELRIAARIAYTSEPNHSMLSRLHRMWQGAKRKAALSRPGI